MTPTEEKLLDALENCVEFIEDAHILEGQWHWHPIEKAQAAITAARQADPPNFCARCGKRLTPEGVHTCTPPAHGERSQFAMLLQELEHLRMQAATAEKWRGLATAKFGDGRTVLEIQREAAEEER